MSERQHRRTLIRKFLRDREICSQDKLVQLLAADGVRFTQATLSRDLRDMGVSCVQGPQGLRYELDPRAR